MAAGDKVQIGTVMKVEFGAFSYTGYLPTSVSNTRIAEVNTIKDERNATQTHIFNNPGKQITVNLQIKSTGSITPPKPGDIITLTPPEGTSTKYLLLSPATVTHGTEVTTLSMTLTREDSMAATYDA